MEEKKLELLNKKIREIKELIEEVEELKEQLQNRVVVTMPVTSGVTSNVIISGVTLEITNGLITKIT